MATQPRYIELHDEMILRVGGTVDPAVPKNWRALMHLISSDISARERNECKSFEELSQLMMSKKLIWYGNYKYLSKKFGTMKLIVVQEDVQDTEQEVLTAMESDENLNSSDNRRKEQLDMSTMKTSTQPRHIELHNEMILRVGGTVDSNVPTHWRPFMFLISNDIKEKDRNSCKSFEEISHCMMTEGLIRYGDYGYLASILGNMGLKLLQEDVLKSQFTIQAIMNEKTSSPSEVDKANAQKKMRTDTVDSGPRVEPSIEKDTEQTKFEAQIEGAIKQNRRDVKFEDIAGLKGAKEAIEEAIFMPMKMPHMFKGIRKHPNGILLFGPPGTGKSRLARAIATEAGDTYTFLPITSADLLSKWVGESEKLVRALFTIARKRKPSIIFIDEIESLCSDRGGDTNVADRIKSQFLTEMQGDDDQILFIGATNLPWSLDPAFRRRFEKRIYIPLPDEESRAEMFKLYISKGINHHLTDEDFKILAEKSNGYSGADIETVVCQAAMALLKKLCKATHFKKVADKGRRNPEKQEHFWTPCSPTDRSAHKKTYKEISDDEIYDAPVTLEDIEASLSKQKPSVSAEDLGKLEKFKNDFGQDGK